LFFIAKFSVKFQSKPSFGIIAEFDALSVPNVKINFADVVINIWFDGLCLVVM